MHPTFARIACCFFASWAAGASVVAAPEQLPARCQALIGKSVPVHHSKGSVVHNYELDRNVRLRRDSIGALCFEKAGELISLGQDGKFQVFTHMD